jgi:hypothetical protein
MLGSGLDQGSAVKGYKCYYVSLSLHRKVCKLLGFWLAMNLKKKLMNPFSSGRAGRNQLGGNRSRSKSAVILLRICLRSSPGCEEINSQGLID